MRSDRTLKKWYNFINRKFFLNELPDNVCVRWADTDEMESHRWEKKYFGEASEAEDDEYHDYQIVMNKSFNKQWIVRISTLVHEMIHIATKLRDNHSTAFERQRQLLSDRGIFKKHALRRNYTLF